MTIIMEGKSKSVLEAVKGQISDLFSLDDDYTFLAGAGVSMDPPSSIPSARAMVKDLFQCCIVPEEIATISSLDLLRYEMVVEAVEKYVDKDLKFLDYLDSATEPNMLHYFLARAIDRGYHVITTNFDYLVEHALLNIIPRERYGDIHAVIMREDFLKYQEPKAYAKAGKKLLFKIHGSKRNILTGATTRESLITTISALGKNKEGTTTFAIEPYKKPAVNSLMQDSCLVVLGYSGSDDFDIGPALKEISGIKRLIWIEHSSAMGNAVEIFRVRESRDQKSLQAQPRVDKLLGEIRNTTCKNVFKIRAGTTYLFGRVLWPLLFPAVPVPDSSESKSPAPNFLAFIEKSYGSVPLLKKHALTGWLYWKLGEQDAFLRCSENAMALAKDEGNIEMESEFLENLGGYYFSKSNIAKAMEYFNKAIQSANQLDEFKRMAVFQNNLGEVFRAKGEFDEALACYQDAIDEAAASGDLQTKAAALNNIGWIHHARGKSTNAETFFKMALEIDEKLGDLPSKAVHLCNIAALQFNRGEYETALKGFKEALKIADQLGEILDKITFLNNIGLIYKNIGDYKTSLASHLEALQIADQAGYLEGKAISMNNVAGFYHDAKLYDEARNYYEGALEIAKLLENKSRESLYLNNLGKLLRDQGNIEDAIFYYETALKTAGEIKDPAMQATCLNNLGSIYLDGNKLDIALTYFNQALEIVEGLTNAQLKETIVGNIDAIKKKSRELEKSSKK